MLILCSSIFTVLIGLKFLNWQSKSDLVSDSNAHLKDLIELCWYSVLWSGSMILPYLKSEAFSLWYPYKVFYHRAISMEIIQLCCLLKLAKCDDFNADHTDLLSLLKFAKCDDLNGSFHFVVFWNLQNVTISVAIIQRCCFLWRFQWIILICCLVFFLSWMLVGRQERGRGGV